MKYLKMVKTFKPSTIKALVEDINFRMSFSRYVSAKDKEAFMKAVNEVYSHGNVADANAYNPEVKDITAELVELLSEIDFDESCEISIEDISGLVKREFTEEELLEQSLISFVEKTISYARVLWNVAKYSRSLEYQVGTSPWVPMLQKLKSFILEDLSKNNPVAVQAWKFVKENSETLRESFTKASQYLKGDGLAWIQQHSMMTRAQIYAKYSTTGFNLDVNSNSPIAQAWGIGTQVTLPVNTKNTTVESIYACSRLIVCSPMGVSKFKVGESPLDAITGYITLFDAMYLLKALKVDIKSLLAAPENHILVEMDKEGKYKVSTNPVDTVFKYKLEEFFGPSNPDTLNKGLLKANKSYEGFAEYTGQGYTSFESAAKAVVRPMKLCKDTKHTITLDKVYVVMDTLGNPFARKALSTGTIHVPTKVLEENGQVRAVSPADMGGCKCTLAPVVAIDKKWDEEGITLASFGSLKAKGYGIAKLLGIEVETYAQEIGNYIKTVNFWGHPIDVVEVSGLTLNVTNHYTIQGYESTARSKLVMSLAEANQEVLERAEERASTITEDSVFVDWVLEQRDTFFGGSLKNTISALLKSGDIRPKSKRVSVTSSEFDILKTTHGVAKAEQWMDSLLAENTDMKEVAQRAIDVATWNYTGNIKSYPATKFFKGIIRLMQDAGLSPNTSVSAFTSRNFLVDLATRVFPQEYNWVELVHGDTKVYLPSGEFMYGKFYKDSTVYDTKVQVTGFLSSFFKAMGYLVKYVYEHPMENLETSHRFANVFKQFTYNLNVELQGYCLGKKVGKLKAEGLSAVLSVAWWEDSIDTVYALGKYKFKTEGKQAVIVKHPELFLESIAGVNVEGRLPKSIIRGLDKDTLNTLSFALSGTVFISEEMALSLQNDGDGDLVRLTWHSDFTLSHFSNAVAKESYFAHKFHNEYTEGERNFTKSAKAPLPSNSYTNTQILQAVQHSSLSKLGVAKYTSLAQKFARYADVTGTDKESVQFRNTHLLLNTMVQVFSMNEIKHTSENQKGVMNLADHFQLANFDVKNRDTYFELFSEFVNKIGGVQGFDSMSDWMDYIENSLLAMKEYFKEGDDPAYLVLGKDFVTAYHPLRYLELDAIMSSKTSYGRILKGLVA